MKRFFVSTFSLLAVVCPVAAVQTAAVGRTDGAYPRPDGTGEHILTVRADLLLRPVSVRPFPLFCLERGEGVKPIPATTYEVAASSRISSHGKPLAPEAAYLYYSFIKGTLATQYDYELGLGREKPSRPLQVAIWSPQSETGDLLDVLHASPQWEPFNSNSAEYARARAFVGEAQESGWTSTDAIPVLNLSAFAQTTAGEADQDVFALLVPAPGALAMGAIGLGALGWLRRRSAL